MPCKGSSKATAHRPELQHTHRQHDAPCCCQHIVQGSHTLDKGLEHQQGQQRPQGLTQPCCSGDSNSLLAQQAGHEAQRTTLST